MLRPTQPGHPPWIFAMINGWPVASEQNQHCVGNAISKPEGLSRVCPRGYDAFNSSCLGADICELVE